MAHNWSNYIMILHVPINGYFVGFHRISYLFSRDILQRTIIINVGVARNRKDSSESRVDWNSIVCQNDLN